MGYTVAVLQSSGKIAEKKDSVIKKPKGRERELPEFSRMDALISSDPGDLECLNLRKVTSKDVCNCSTIVNDPILVIFQFRGNYGSRKFVTDIFVKALNVSLIS